MPKKTLYKVIFHNQGKIYEIYARDVHQGVMFGFIEIDKLIFGEKTSPLIIVTSSLLSPARCSKSLKL